MLEVIDLSFKYTDKMIIDHANMSLYQKDHACLLGLNGVGKSTLMKLIVKDLIPDGGKVSWIPSVKYSYLDQHLTIDDNLTVKEYIYGVYEKLFEKEKRMQDIYQEMTLCEESQYEKLLNRANILYEELEQDNFYNIKVEVDNVLAGIGLSTLNLDSKFKTLSGGMKEKIFLAKLLLDKADCILLDEPTNFLDKEHISWLANYLNNFKGAYLVISHDMVFVSMIASTIFELKNGVISRYNGNYEFYIKEKEIRDAQYLKDYLAQQRYIKKETEFINKNIVRATTTTRAKSRRTALEKLEIIAKPQGERQIHINFKPDSSTGNDVFTCKDLVIGYNGVPLLAPISFDLFMGNKICITGKNGVGKSTLLKTILGQIPAISGTYKFGPSVKIVYYEQERKFPNIKPIPYVRMFYPDYNDEKIRALLARKGLFADSINKTVDILSGGEQTKIRFAILEEQKGNVLVLDEPTNHLDINAKKELYRALNEYDSAVILVSHDEEFVDAVCDFEIVLEK